MIKRITKDIGYVDVSITRGSLTPTFTRVFIQPLDLALHGKTEAQLTEEALDFLRACQKGEVTMQPATPVHTRRTP